MKIKILITLFVIITLGIVYSLFAQTAESSLNWETGAFSEIQQKARTENKISFALFVSDNCGHCKKLKKNVLPDPRVQEILSKLIITQIDINSDEGRKLSGEYGFKSTPVVILFEPDGSEIDRIVGNFSVNDYLVELDDYVQRKNTIGYYEQRYENNPADPEALYNLGVKYINRRKIKKAYEFFDRTAEVDSVNTSGFTDDALYRKGRYLHKQKKVEKVVPLMLSVLNKYPQSDNAVYAFDRLMWCYTELKQPEKMIEAYQAYIEKIPEEAKPYRVAATELTKKNWEGKIYWDTAYEAINRAVELEPDEARNYNLLSTIESHYEKYEQALIAIDKAIALNPQNKKYTSRRDELLNKIDNQQN